MRFRHPALLALALAACTAAQAPLPAEDFPMPASPLARAAIVEWEAWGRVVVIGWPESRPSDMAVTPERFSRLLDYWTTVPGGSRIAHRFQDMRSATMLMQRQGEGEIPGDGAPRPDAPLGTAGWEDASVYENPAWSAAFISAVARRAHVPERDLPSTERHARYIDAVLEQALSDPESAAFLPHAPEDRAPAPGDLLCADRSHLPLAHWSGRLAESGRPRPMHCDVVVRTLPGSIDAVGGNVEGLVVLRRFPADSAGRVLPAPWGRPPFVLVLAARDEASAPTTRQGE